MSADGVGELSLVWPTLARLTQAGQTVVLIGPPYRPHAPAWHAAGLDLRQLQIVEATPRDALWAAEQSLRSGACRAVLCWPQRANDRALRRLVVAAETGQVLGIAFRPLRVLKCRGGDAPPQTIPLTEARR